MYERASQADRLEARMFARLLDTFDRSPMAHAILARAYISTNQLSLAQQELTRALDLDSGLPEAHLILGELYFALERAEEARAEWRYAQTAENAPDWVITTAAHLLESNAS